MSKRNTDTYDEEQDEFLQMLIAMADVAIKVTDGKPVVTKVRY